MGYEPNDIEYLEAKKYLNSIQSIAGKKAPEKFNPENIEGAPIIEGWNVEDSGFGYQILVGKVTGHPHIQNGPIYTSALIWFDENLGWARTLYRFYRLGTPAKVPIGR